MAAGWARMGDKQIMNKKEKKFISLVVYLHDVASYVKYFLDTMPVQTVR